MREIAIVAVTFADRVGADHVVEQVIEERLAACVTLSACHAVFRWAATVERSDEVAADFKTSAAGAPALAARLMALHAYDLPAVTVHRAQAPAAVADWIEHAVA